MCEYIKDDGEKCGMDTEPFCRHHDDSEQAEEWRDEKREAYGAVSGASDDSLGGEMETHCDECGAALRRRERLREHPHSPRRVVFEAYVECDCAEHTLGTKGVRRADLPGGWE